MEPPSETALEISLVGRRVCCLFFLKFLYNTQYYSESILLTYPSFCPADLNQMHKLNEEAYSNPEQWQRRATATMTARQAELPDPNKRVSGTVAEYSVHDSSDRLSGTVTILLLNVFSSLLPL